MLKIIDFGIANAVPDHTINVYRENQIGTPNYMAPKPFANQIIPQQNLEGRQAFGYMVNRVYFVSIHIREGTFCWIFWQSKIDGYN